MDLRVGERVMHPAGSDTALLSPLQRPLLLNPFTPQHCAQYSQHLRFNMEQHLQDQEDKKQQLQLIMHKDKSQQSAVASSVVKQKLAEVILKKRKEKSSTNPLSSTPVAYRELAPDPSVSLQPHLSSPPQPHPDGPDDPPLRRATSEPNLKVKHKLKKHLNTRKSPLTRKESAPPTIKHRAPDTLDSSPSSSSTPVSGCSSPNDSLPNENGVLPPAGALSHEAQRILLPDGSLAHFSVPVHSSLPTITLGLPAHAKVEGEVGGLKLGRVPLVSGGSPVLVPLGVEEQSAPLLQPLFILEPSGLVHAPLLAVPGLSPLQFSAAPGPHKPLSRTRSEPLPPSPRTLHTHLLHQQHHGNQILHRLKQHTHLGKLMTKSSEKPRLRQIPSEDMDSEEGGSSGAESMREAESQDDQLNLQQTLILNQSRLWETQKQLQQLRRQTAHMETLAVPMMLSGVHRPLSRTQSSPASTSLTLPEKTLPITSSAPETHSQPRFTTGLVYDSQMLKHQCTCGDNSTHPEHAGRIQSIWSRLQERGLRVQCESIRGRKATLEELQSVHTERHVLLYGTNPLNRLKLDNRNLAGILSQRMFVMLPCGGVGVDNDTIWNEMHTSTASRMAAGSVTELAFRVAKGELKNGFAVVRPPGHHADPSNPMGFCFFNSVAIAAKQLQQKLSVTKILIVDWDVHHGNGTQEIFYNDPSVLYISLHRYDNGNFFPGSGGPTEVGSGAGEGFNVNVAWTGGLEPPMGDAEYLAAFRTVVMPIAREFSPDVVLVSSGFDAAEGHPAPLGGYKVTAKCFGFLTRQLMVLAGGRVVLALEGGHDLTAICDASEACVSALLGVEDPFPEEVLLQKPNDNAVLSLQRVLQIQSQYWSSVKAMVGSVGSAFLGAPAGDCEETAVKALASLSVGVLTNKSLPDEPMEHDQ
ncbi:histone deacetylase 7 [Astyanax mexicanus]|uniref:histone deacetylase 7 n=1 Tax=Astyanax mexicanus TaxID=7994 RepID=UPI0020CB1759|nr:histone deacetylase 7 [Astyanax mexicanus]XP_049342451.1 histone deacetylase 7 [Astyanax mexicanus]XP_049342452.1 histone deacetylase 7 [Astyanax mexicanus]XP_049342453.1 histone deacetylase 7 [Astyanax mexicanus]XP_049342454.1 histone deacetylase 7 [Astyanax mexicanus]XP_049342455.1 histone deacetylase 7 [Astyanax mexicanus]XP_049342456.1 histone deacetylase 7 [Astyanax mexicanus]XP_049342457.1 histone deacetylase 7 [Astyanax mexicanus]XP_049342458.1 histone deacetylase 7 [Astyanax mexi